MGLSSTTPLASGISTGGPVIATLCGEGQGLMVPLRTCDDRGAKHSSEAGVAAYLGFAVPQKRRRGLMRWQSGQVSICRGVASPLGSCMHTVQERPPRSC